MEPFRAYQPGHDARYCAMKIKTVKEGGKAVIFNYLGEGRLVDGPCRVFLFRERIQYLHRYTATQYEYLVVTDNTGLVRHIPGPVEMFHNPLEHQNIKVMKATQIEANKMIIVYKKLPDHSVERRVIEGPTVFVPAAEEWLHQFKWHAPSQAEEGRHVPGKNTFTQLSVIPNHFNYKVKEVRTTDDIMLSVDLMIFYEMKDVLKMLDTSQDPLADMMNAVCSDLIAVVGKLTFNEFLEATQKLNILETFPQMLQRAEKIGYQINKVVYCGYHSSDQLQAMQDNTIRSRAEMRLNAELQTKRDQLQDFKLRKEQARTQMRQNMEKSQTEHRQRIEKSKQTHELQVSQYEQENILAYSEMFYKAALECEKAKKEQEEDLLRDLKDLDVNLTSYLVNKNPTPIDQQYQIVDRQSKKSSQHSENITTMISEIA